MTTYTAIANSSVDAGSPIDEALVTTLRDNPIAITEGATGAPAVTAEALEAMQGTAAVGDFPVASMTIPYSGNVTAGTPFGSNTYANRVAVFEVKKAGTYRLKMRAVCLAESATGVFELRHYINGASGVSSINVGASVATGQIDEATATLTGLVAGDEISFSIDAESAGGWAAGLVGISISADTLDYVNQRVSEGLQYF